MKKLQYVNETSQECVACPHGYWPEQDSKASCLAIAEEIIPWTSIGELRQRI